MRIVALTRVLLYVKSRNNYGQWAGHRSIAERLKDNCVIWQQNLSSGILTTND